MRGIAAPLYRKQIHVSPKKIVNLMDGIVEKELSQKVETGTLSVEERTQNPEFRALLSLRNFNAILEKHYAEILEIEAATDEMNLHAMDIGKENCSTESLGNWQDALKQFKDAVAAVNKVLTEVKEKVIQQDRSDSSLLWQMFDTQMKRLLASYATIEALGAEILPETAKTDWAANLCQFQEKILPLITSYGAACRVELRIIERYTPEELNEVTQIILEHIPENFTFAQADQYEKEYLAALGNFRKEFSQKKNLWDKFLDVLAGGDHQSPSEHVMMQRWLDGEKGDDL
jgi:hypothetical protein